MKRLIAMLLICVSILVLFPQGAVASGEVEEDTSTPTANEESLAIKAKSAILMDAKTGKILYEQNAKLALPPASVTKIMTLLLAMESIESGKIQETDMVTISEYAASMGGSQVFLAVGEQFSVKDLLKCTVIASANDAAVALAEHCYGSETAFVTAMNERAKEMGLTSTVFENVTGLDDTTVTHETSAMDIAVMSRKLITYPIITEFSSTWMDSIRDGAFTLSNTNRLVRYYPGATGLKTGSTAKAKFCLSATAKRDGMTLIAVIMGADTRDIRNSEAMRLLDYGFANYTLYCSPDLGLEDIYVTRGVDSKLKVYADDFAVVVEKGKKDKISYSLSLPNAVEAPIKEHDEIGTVTYQFNGETVGICKIKAANSIDSISFGGLFNEMMKTFLHPN